MLAEVPGISGYAERDSVLEYMHVFRRKPSDYDILDLVQFCWGSVAKPRRIKNHNFHSHYDLAFDEDAGKQEFAEKIETSSAGTVLRIGSSKKEGSSGSYRWHSRKLYLDVTSTRGTTSWTAS